MSQERKFKWLNDRRVIYRRNPINDKPTIETDKYMFYEDGTHECYTLFASRAKITTYRSLKWHFLVLYYLNEELLDLEFASICHMIADKENGFVTFFIKDKLLHEMIKDVIEQGGDPPINRLRKVIFKPYNMLTLSEKLTIVGQLIGRRSKVWPEDIYQTMLDLNEWGKKITWWRVAGLLDCSVRTIYRNLNNQLKQEKQILNEEL